jgi:Peptidase C13 family
MGKRFFLANVLAVMALLLAGCATNPYDGDGRVKSDALLKQQLDVSERQRTTKPEGRIIFAGFAMHSQSKAFRNDVLTAEKSVLSIDPNAIVFKLNNPAFGQDADWPFATTQNIEAVLKKMGSLARPEDKVVVLMSTHGNVDVLSVNFSTKNYPHVSPGVLNQWLAELRGKSTLLLLSACYSGSFIEPLRNPNRVILAAASKDRSSFGCQFHSDNTYFIDALLNQPSLPDRSVVQLMDQAKITVERKEKEQKLAPPSMPRFFIGATAKEWANQPLKEWLKPQ